MSGVRRATRKASRAGVVRPRVRLENDERRGQLLELAGRAFAERAYDEVSIDDLAREAKISKGLLYHYFPTKRDLYVATVRVTADELVRKVTSVPVDLPPPERIRAGLEAYLEHVETHARSFVSLMRGGIGSDPEVAAVIEGVRRRLADKFLDGSPFAPLLAGNTRFQLAVRGWLGFVEAASIAWCQEPRGTSRTELRELLAQVIGAILGVVAPQLLQAPAAR